MNNTQNIISFKEIDRETLRNYYDYGFVIHKIREKLFQEFGFEFKMFALARMPLFQITAANYKT